MRHALLALLALPALVLRPRFPLRRVAHGAAVLATLGVIGCSEAAPPPPPPCDLGLVSQLEVERAMDHLRALSVDIGPRVASSPAEREAADYLARELASYGYQVEIQSFPRVGVVAHLSVDAPGAEQVHVAAGRVSDTPAAEYPLLTPEGGITGRLVDCGAGACPPEVAGQIALLAPVETGEGDADGSGPERPVRSAEDRIADAASAGAAAVLLHGNDWRRFVVSVASAPIPFATLNLDGAQALRDAGEVAVTLEVNRYDTSQNVIATRRHEGTPGEPLTGAPNEEMAGAAGAPIVVFSAHYDSVEKAPGASDNGSGTVGLLEIARILADVPVAVELRFAAVGAEEVGLQGARYYVAQLPEEERARIVANFNMDMIGTAGEDQVQLFVNTLDGDNLVARSARAAREKLGYPEALIRAPFQRGASDHVAFHDAGIPAANFIWREPETIALEPWYHHPYDTFERVSEERLRTALSIVLGAALEVICEAPTEADLPS
jgi:aminopeptidase YwaD